ncbi:MULTISPECIES: MFS transporter [unclassified Bradyrhizobium]|uniref:MFS transporter n=1 Tax=Bradyrhizobium TaxID=374 RepID=UPI0024E04B28|nr:MULTISPECIES: MFS transporter [unclassified Bradyrhizobium]
MPFLMIAAVAVSLTGLSAQRLSMAWAMWTMTHSSVWVASIAVSDLVSTLITSGPAGAIIDRADPAAIYRLSQVAACIQGLTLLTLVASGAVAPFWILVCSAWLGICTAFSLPARLSLIPLMVQRENYVRLVTLNSLASNGASFLGPVIAGWLISNHGLQAAAAVVVAAYVPSTIMSPPVRTLADAMSARSTHLPVDVQIRDGIAHLRHNPQLWILLSAFTTLALTARGILSLGSAISETVLGGGVDTLARLASFLAAGGLAGGLLASIRLMDQLTSISVTMSGAAIALLLYGVSPKEAIALGGAFALGIFLSLNNIAVISAIQLGVHPEYRGRLNSLYNILLKAGPALGALVFGCVSELIDIRAAVMLSAISLLIVLRLLLRVKTSL